MTKTLKRGGYGCKKKLKGGKSGSIRSSLKGGKKNRKSTRCWSRKSKKGPYTVCTGSRGQKKKPRRSKRLRKQKGGFFGMFKNPFEGFFSPNKQNPNPIPNVPPEPSTPQNPEHNQEPVAAASLQAEPVAAVAEVAVAEVAVAAPTPQQPVTESQQPVTESQKTEDK